MKVKLTLLENIIAEEVAKEGIVDLKKGGHWTSKIPDSKPSSVLRLAHELAEQLRGHEQWMRVLELIYEELAELQDEPEEEEPPKRRIGFAEELEIRKMVRETLTAEGVYSPEGGDMEDQIVTSGDTPPEREGYLEARIVDAITLLKQGHSEEALEELLGALTAKL